MKRLLWCLLILLPSICTCFAGLGDADDGELTLGEYDYDVQLDNYDELLIKGGGGPHLGKRSQLCRSAIYLNAIE